MHESKFNKGRNKVNSKNSYLIMNSNHGKGISYNIQISSQHCQI